jgi:hypothetical protein
MEFGCLPVGRLYYLCAPKKYQETKAPQTRLKYSAIRGGDATESFIKPGCDFSLKELHSPATNHGKNMPIIFTPKETELVRRGIPALETLRSRPQ